MRRDLKVGSSAVMTVNVVLITPILAFLLLFFFISAFLLSAGFYCVIGNPVLFKLHEGGRGEFDWFDWQLIANRTRAHVHAQPPHTHTHARAQKCNQRSIPANVFREGPTKAGAVLSTPPPPPSLPPLFLLLRHSHFPKLTAATPVRFP